jgi:hypothetical protein
MKKEVKQISGTSTTIFWWDNMAEIVQAFMATGGHRQNGWSNSWMGETLADVQRRCVNGLSDHIEDAEYLLEDLVLQVETPGIEWQNSVAGPRPCIPSAVAGRPDSMRRPVVVEDDRRPVVIAVDITSSGGIGVETLRKRGTVLLAMTMAIAKTRPVELYVLSALGGWNKAGVNCIRVGTTPLNLSLASYALSSQGLCRGVGYDYLNRNSGTFGGWAWGLHPTGSDRHKYLENMTKALAGPGIDFKFIPPVHLRDELLTDPVGFIKRSVAEIEGREDE